MPGASSDAPPMASRQADVRICIVAGEVTCCHLQKLLATIENEVPDTFEVQVTCLDPRSLRGESLLDAPTKERKYDLMFVSLGAMLDVETMLIGDDASLSTVVVALTSDLSLTEGDIMDSGCQGLLHSPVSLVDMRHTLHKFMPRHCAAVPLPPIAAKAWGSRLLPKRVLQVEPCPITANAMQLMFSEMGLWMDTAQDGESAMEMIAKRNFDLLLFDLNLPGGLSGCALASWYKALCKREGRPAAAVVMVTAESLVPNCEAFGVDFWLMRPLSTRAVAQLLAEWLQGSGEQPPRAAGSELAPPDLCLPASASMESMELS
jgi:CheY-like chemotaxis protein